MQNKNREKENLHTWNSNIIINGKETSKKIKNQAGGKRKGKNMCKE